MNLTRIYSLFLTHQDIEAKKILTDYLISDNQAKQNIQVYLNAALERADSIDALEAIDLFSHFSDLKLVSIDNGGTVEDFQSTVINLEDLEIYNRCGRREFKQILSPLKISFYNELTGLKVEADLHTISSILEVVP
ncbi:hypothetical protein [uncultured Vagococcus sp.]|uniref:hypothetical protein n=1 Tax=uncultured Vagococcus sp. TaxID=189676 RepID=UPI0028D51FBD|nr:hypothetical protein [uncultured Vagococcus sp.]